MKCGDWNINSIQNSPHERELRYNLKHTVNVPTRITKTTATLLDVMITNENNSIGSSVVMDLSLLDHHAQVLSITISDFSNAWHRIKRRQFSEDNVQEFLYLLTRLLGKKFIQHQMSMLNSVL
jgi:hypothetical protein